MTSPYVPPRNRNSIHIVRSQDYLTQKIDNATILNLDEYLRNNNLYTNFNQKEYDNFKSFQKSVFEKLATEVDKNIGEIIQYHVYNPKYKQEIKDMFDKYKAIYIDTIIKTESHKQANEGKPYPFFIEDLNSKNTIIYEEFEKNIGITTKIEDQNDEEFFNTLGKRIEGVNKCKTDPNYSEEFKTYLIDEYNREIIKYNNHKSKI